MFFKPLTRAGRALAPACPFKPSPSFRRAHVCASAASPPPSNDDAGDATASLWDSDIVQAEYEAIMIDADEVCVRERERGAVWRVWRGERAGAATATARAPAPAPLNPALSPPTPTLTTRPLSLPSLSRTPGQLMALQPKFPDFDAGGQAIFLDRLDALAGRVAVFTARMRLCGDGRARAWVRDTDGGLGGVGASLEGLEAGLKAATDAMRGVVAAKAAAGPGSGDAATWGAAARASLAAGPALRDALAADPAAAASLADPATLAAVRAALFKGAGGEGVGPEAHALLADPAVGPLLRKLLSGGGGGGAAKKGQQRRR